MTETNPYYRHFLAQSGAGGVDIPDLGEIYRYKSALRKGYGHLFHTRIRQRKGLGFGTFLSSLYQRAKPLLKVLGAQAVNVISGIAKDTISGQNIKDATIRNIAKALPPGLIPVIKPNTVPDTATNISPEGPEAVVSDLPPPPPSKKRRKKTVLAVKQGVKRSGRGLTEIYPGLEYL